MKRIKKIISDDLPKLDKHPKFNFFNDNKTTIQTHLNEIRTLFEIPLKDIEPPILEKSFTNLNVLIKKAKKDFLSLKDISPLNQLSSDIQDLKSPESQTFVALVVTLKKDLSSLSSAVETIKYKNIQQFQNLKNSLDSIKLSNNQISIPVQDMIDSLNKLKKEINKFSNKSETTRVSSIFNLQKIIFDNINIPISDRNKLAQIKQAIETEMGKVLLDYQKAAHILITDFSNSFSQQLGKIEENMKADLSDNIKKISKKIEHLLDQSPSSGPPNDSFNRNVQLILGYLPFWEPTIQSHKSFHDCKFGFGNSQAETDCDFYLDIRSGVEFIGDNDFDDSFPRVELRLMWRLFEIREFEEYWGNKLKEFKDFIKTNPNPTEIVKAEIVKREHKTKPDGTYEFFVPWRFQLNANGALTSRNKESATTGPGGLTTISGTKALEGYIGLQIDFLDIYRKNSSDMFDPTFSMGLLFEGGFIDPLEETNNTDGDLLRTHFIGSRMYYRGENVANGAYFDFGWRFNEAFDNQDPRRMFRAYIPFRITDTNTKVFGGIEVDAGKGRDETKLILGLSIPLDRVVGSIKSLFIKVEEKNTNKELQ